MRGLSRKIAEYPEYSILGWGGPEIATVNKGSIQRRGPQTLSSIAVRIAPDE